MNTDCITRINTDQKKEKQKNEMRKAGKKEKKKLLLTFLLSCFPYLFASFIRVDP